MAKQKDFHAELALHMASRYAKMLMPRLAEIVASVIDQERDASLTVTAQFSPSKTKGGPEYKVTMKPRVRTPEEAVEINLLEVNGQLALYDQNPELAALRGAAEEGGDPGANGGGGEYAEGEDDPSTEQPPLAAV